jgi:hypothetical protein
MGKKKIDPLQKITNINKRTITYCKRRKGLVNKAIELSMMCEQRIFLAIFDEQKDRLTTY